MPDLPEIVCICGSTRFVDEMRAANRDLTLAGVIVVAPGEADELITNEQKIALGTLHLRKIDLADRVLVVNVNVCLSSPSPRSPRAVPPVLRSASTALCHPQG
ncbi:hypothetical protein [Streptomyces uncialis]|uniref:hypothetical protein n=1 Tax=Streptomyces uncialis TaxID=1048205 RepID=UPI0037BD2C9F